MLILEGVLVFVGSVIPTFEFATAAAVEKYGNERWSGSV